MNLCFATYKRQLEEQKIQFDNAVQNRNVFLLDMSCDSILFLLSQMYPYEDHRVDNELLFQKISVQTNVPFEEQIRQQKQSFYTALENRDANALYTAFQMIKTLIRQINITEYFQNRPELIPKYPDDLIRSAYEAGFPTEKDRDDFCLAVSGRHCWEPALEE